ncbi:Protein of unknown function DUF974 domain-containing protein [Rozella allomycis CSF55]|uniref:DUF974-domain-containing protein n=1 Tax=Rozella allomycis (strain CSF55) TaxID=988480 RepID=A0A075B4X9_ROZAC|nr:Protein of unknown function DUF974 domain-containing protein [Rozella allomycis CSF55]|eukprot:EPZ36561.1 Protein of unknown function DUF974 domain-containing protein [Rozella allomycis CSF55]
MQTSASSLAIKDQQPITFKVFRLNKPNIMPENVSDNIFQNPLSENGPAPVVPALSISQTFGNIYLGQNLSCLVSLLNGEDCAINVSDMRIELHTTANRFLLFQAQNELIKEKGSLQKTISYEIKEFGQHMMVCTSVIVVNGEERNLRKKVLNPMSVKTKVNNIVSDSSILLEVQLQNLMSYPVVMEKLYLESNNFIVKDLQFLDENTKVYERSMLFNPDDIRQYLFHLKPKSDADLNVLGKLDIQWRSSGGEAGRLQTSALTRKAPKLPDIQVSLEKLHSDVCFEKCFVASFSVKNNKDKDLRNVVFSWNGDRMKSLLIQGSVKKNISNLKAGESISLDYTFLPISRGFFSLEGLCIFENEHKISEHDKIADVYVQ